MAKDPVCGMDVAETSDAQQLAHDGKTYYFCAPGCRKAFEREPAKYLAPGHQPHM